MHSKSCWNAALASRKIAIRRIRERRLPLAVVVADVACNGCAGGSCVLRCAGPQEGHRDCINQQEVGAALCLNIAIVAAITTKEVGWDAAEPRRAGEEAVMTYDLTIRGGTVIDGTGAPARTADVAVIDGVIALQKFRHIMLSMMCNIIAIIFLFSLFVTFAMLVITLANRPSQTRKKQTHQHHYISLPSTN